MSRTKSPPDSFHTACILHLIQIYVPVSGVSNQLIPTLLHDPAVRVEYRRGVALSWNRWISTGDGLTSTIFVVEDEPDVRELLRVTLEGDGHVVKTAQNGVAAKRIIENLKPDLILLDVGMPGIDGFELARRIRETSAVPIIFVTAAVAEADQLRGFGVGGNDYIVKPFSLAVLRARVREQLKTSRPQMTETITLGNVQINTADRIVQCNGVTLELTSYEYRLLELLGSRVGKLVRKSEILNKIWDDEYADPHVIENTLYRLRAKLAASGANRDLITTHRGMGFRANRR